MVIITALPTANASPLNNEIQAVVPPEQVTVVTDPVPVPIEAPQPVPEPAKPVQVVKETKKPTGTKLEWLQASGIPESEWWAVDYIVSKESSWNPNAVNKSSGACGLAQALPCSKLGTNWNDPVHALKWQHQYVISRYGGYAEAYHFWVKNKWY